MGEHIGSGRLEMGCLSTDHKVAEGFVGSQEYRQKVQAGSAPYPILWP